MKRKKIIAICAFLLLILVTATAFLIAAIDSYNYDMDPANGVDIMEGMGAAFLIIIGGFVILCELDLFFTVYYFLVKPKTSQKSRRQNCKQQGLQSVRQRNENQLRKENGVPSIGHHSTDYVTSRVT